MDAAEVIAVARERAGMTLRRLAALAGTSHATISAYETGAKVPTAATLDRVVRAAGFALDVRLARRIDGDDRSARGDELAAVLELAAAFPARHDDRLRYPVFGRR